MNTDEILRAASEVIDRAWHRCAMAENQELLSMLGGALRDVLIERQREQQRRSEDIQRAREIRERHYQEEEATRSRMAAAEADANNEEAQRQ